MHFLRCASTGEESSEAMTTETVTEQQYSDSYSELEIYLRQLGWTVTMTPLMEVKLRWPEAMYSHEWRVAKGPLEVRAPNAAEVTRLVSDVETRARAAASGGIRIERVDGPIPPRCSVLRRPPKEPAVPKVPRKRRKRVTMELVRCGFFHERHGTYCGALIWHRELEQIRHAADSHGISDIKAALALFQAPRRKLGNVKESRGSR